MPRPTETKLREAFALAEYELSGRQIADERGLRIFELRAKGIKDFHEIARQVGGISYSVARQLYERELARRVAERPDLVDANLEEILAGLDASAKRLNRLLDDVDDDTDLTIGQRVFAVTKLEEQLRKVDESRRKLLALDAPDRLAVLVGSADAGPSPEELASMSIEEIQERLEKQKQLRAAVARKIESHVVSASQEPEEGPLVDRDNASSASDPAPETGSDADRR